MTVSPHKQTLHCNTHIEENISNFSRRKMIIHNSIDKDKPW